MLYYYLYQWELGGGDPAPMHTVHLEKPQFGASDVYVGIVIHARCNLEVFDSAEMCDIFSPPQIRAG